MPNTPFPIYPDVKKYQNGELLDADTMNVPINQLERRTDWLYRRLGTIVGSQNRASVRLSNVELDDGVEAGDVVYFNPATGLFCKALARTLVESNPFHVSAGSSLAVGIVAEANDDVSHAFGTVVLSGLLDFDSLADVQALVESGIEFKSGPYYLSAREPGKITSNPSGPAIYVGMFFSDNAPGENPDSPASTSSIPSTAKHGAYALLSPQYKDLAEMHHHRAFVLSGNIQQGIESDEDSSVKLYVSGTYTGTRAERYSIRLVYKTSETNLDGERTFTTDDFPESDDWFINVYAECKEWNNFTTTYHKLYEAKNSGDILFQIGNSGLIGRLLSSQVGNSIQPFSFGSFDEGDESAFITDSIKGWGLITPEDVASNPYLAEIVSVPAPPGFSVDGYVSIDGVYKAYSLNYKYKYEVGLDPDLAQFFPPFPINGTAFVMNGIEYPSTNLWGEERGVYFVTSTAIYWKGEDPLTDAAFYLTRGAFPSSSFVTSIKAAKDSGIKIRQEGTTGIANTGNLVIDAQIPIEKSNPGLAGYMVPKDVVNNKLLFGPVVSSISVGPGLSMSSVQGPGAHYGDIRIDFDSSHGGGGAFDDVVLHNAKQELVGAFPYIKLLGSNDVASGFTIKMHVPILTPPVDGGYKLLFYMSAFSLSNTSANVAAGINIQTSVLRDWYPGCSDASWYANRLDSPTHIGTDSDVYAIPFGEGEKFDPIFVHNDDLWPNDENVARRHYLLLTSQDPGRMVIDGLQPNSSVAITIRRAVVAGNSGGGNYTNYSGEIGFMNMSWKLVPGSSPSV